MEEDLRKNRRSSILKPQKPKTPLKDSDEDDTARLRRVSFRSSNFVKQFIHDPEQNTVWDTTYEEAVNHTDSTQSSSQNTNTSEPKTVTCDDMELTNLECDKENVMINPEVFEKFVAVSDQVSMEVTSCRARLSEVMEDEMEFTKVVPKAFFAERNENSLLNATSKTDVSMEFTKQLPACFYFNVESTGTNKKTEVINIKNGVSVDLTEQLPICKEISDPLVNDNIIDPDDDISMDLTKHLHGHVFFRDKNCTAITENDKTFDSCIVMNETSEDPTLPEKSEHNFATETKCSYVPTYCTNLDEKDQKFGNSTNESNSVQKQEQMPVLSKISVSNTEKEISISGSDKSINHCKLIVETYNPPNVAVDKSRTGTMQTSVNTNEIANTQLNESQTGTKRDFPGAELMFNACENEITCKGSSNSGKNIKKPRLDPIVPIGTHSITEPTPLTPLKPSPSEHAFAHLPASPNETGNANATPTWTYKPSYEQQESYLNLLQSNCMDSMCQSPSDFSKIIKENYNPSPANPRFMILSELESVSFRENDAVEDLEQDLRISMEDMTLQNSVEEVEDSFAHITAAANELITDFTINLMKSCVAEEGEVTELPMLNTCLVLEKLYENLEVIDTDAEFIVKKTNHKLYGTASKVVADKILLITLREPNSTVPNITADCESTVSSSSGTEESREVIEINESTDDDDVIIVPTIREKIEESASRNRLFWNVAKISGDVYVFRTMYNAIILKVTVSEVDGLVTSLETFSKPSGSAKPIFVYVLRIFETFLSATSLKHALGEKFDVLSLLDYLPMTMRKMLKYFDEYKRLQRKNLLKMHSDFSVQFKVMSDGLNHIWEVKMENVEGQIDMEKVKVVAKCGFDANENKVRQCVSKCPTGFAFITEFVGNMEKYINSLGAPAPIVVDFDKWFGDL